jgi:hypothetical protein
MKRRLADYAVWIAIFLCSGLLAAILAYPAYAQELTQGRGIICDTETQLTRYAALAPQPTAIETVNQEAGSDHACGIALVAFYIGKKHGQVRIEGKAYEVTDILVVGTNTGMGWQRLTPFAQFTLIAVKEEES